MIRYVSQNTEPLSLHFEEWLGVIERCRFLVSQVIGASVDEVALMSSTSAGLGTIALAVEWKVGDRVWFLADDFPSNRYVWQNLARFGVKAEGLSLSDDEELLAILNAKDARKLRLLAVPAVSYRTGRLLDIPTLAAWCQERDILLAVDAIQAVGAINVDVKKWNCDFLACGGQKWLMGPVGTGFIYVRNSQLPRVQVPIVGWTSTNRVLDFESERFQFANSARRFEPAMLDVPAFAGLAKSLEILLDIGLDTISKQIRSHNFNLRTTLSQLNLPLLHCHPSGMETGIVSTYIKDDNSSAQLVRIVEKNKVIATVRNGYARFSAHAFNRAQEIDQLAELFRVRAKLKTLPQPNSLSFESVTSFNQLNPPSECKTALIIGATSKLGSAFAKCLANDGYSLLLLGRDLGQLEQHRLAFLGKSNATCKIIAVDLEDRVAVTEAVKNFSDDLEKCDVMINCAATADVKSFLDTDSSGVRQVFETNFFSPWAIAHPVVRGMKARGYGWIMQCITTGARSAWPYFSTYAASKAALWAWNESLAREMRSAGITVTCFLPPHMESPLAENLSRKALAIFAIQQSQRRKSLNMKAVVTAALKSMNAGLPLHAPWTVRLQLAVNQLFPALITKKIAKFLR